LKPSDAIPERDSAELGRAIVDASMYMVVATTNDDGSPWVSPVYFAHAEYREYFWVSRPQANHSRNIDARPRISIVVFDSSAPIGTGQAVYMTAEAKVLAGGEREKGIEVFSRRSLEHGGNVWTLENVQAPAELRLYRSTALEQYVLAANDQRIPVAL
jgi:hypothetical protein